MSARGIVLSSWRPAAVLLFFTAFALSACSESNSYIEPPPPKVTVAQPLVQEITDYLDFTGTTVASARVEIRARVGGVLDAAHFVPGTAVEAGTLLFTIDPREYEATLLTAEAELAAAQSELERAEIEFARAERLFKENAASDSEVVKWRGERQLATAQIKRAEASIARANLDLEYTKIVAPIKGRVGRALVDPGNLVGEGEATVLTDIVRYHPMYAYFSLNERDLLRVMALYRARVAERGIDPSVSADAEAGIAIFMGLADEEGYPHAGVLDFGESGVDPETGTLRLRGIFDNNEIPANIIPGLFARIRFPIATRPDMPLVTERAIGSDQSGRFVLVVNAENRVEKRAVDLGHLEHGMRVIERGVSGDDWIVVNGLQRARPGAEVQAEKIEIPTLVRDTESARTGSATGAAGEAPADDAGDTPADSTPQG